jgi:hypothetical protein
VPLPELFERTRQSLGLSPPDASALKAKLSGVGRTLKFTMQPQKREEWCWAAVSVSVSRFYDAQSPWSQCGLVNAELSLGDCCSGGGADACNQPWYLEYGLERVGHLSGKLESSISFADVGVELDARRPPACWVKWPDGTGHFVVLNGYATDFAATPPAEWVSVQDPKYGHSDYRYLKFLVSYRKVGGWTFSYFTRP